MYSKAFCGTTMPRQSRADEAGAIYHMLNRVTVVSSCFPKRMTKMRLFVFSPKVSRSIRSRFSLLGSCPIIVTSWSGETKMARWADCFAGSPERTRYAITVTATRGVTGIFTKRDSRVFASKLTPIFTQCSVMRNGTRYV